MDLATRFAGLLADDGVVRGLIGPREAPRLWERHLLNCALLADALPLESDVCDIGSGAGLPGLVLAIRRPDLRVTLVEPLLRRTTFLTEVVEWLSLEHVEVVRARAEELHGTREFSIVTSRAVAPLGRLLDWSMPLVRQHGHLVAMKGSSAQGEIEASARELRRHGAGTVEVLTYGDAEIDPPTTVVRVEATRPSGLRWDAADQHRRDTRNPGGARARKGRRS
ncbi:MAG: 16S rRNA (guanine(527)-N(7))-methyltransferase RsmG [Nocardioidaceae bacterium]